MEMTPGQLLFAARVADEQDQFDMDRMVIAGCVAQADKKGRDRYFKDR